MISEFTALRALTLGTACLRMFIAFLLGSAIGLERSIKNRSAGFRTHILVTLGSTVASMTGLYLYLNNGLPTDISRIGASVVSGLGFIGAGTIVVTTKPKVSGLTTAAGLWASGIIGVAVGAGFYEGAVIATILVLVAQIVFTFAEQTIRHSPEIEITLGYNDKEALDQAMRYCKDHRLAIVNLRVTGSDGAYNAELTLRPAMWVDRERIYDHIRDIPGIIEMNKMEM